MQCHANCMDITNVLKIKHFMELKDIALDAFQYRSLMTLYLKNKVPLKALSAYNEYVRTLADDEAPHKEFIAMKNSTFLVLLEENIKKGCDDANTEHYYTMVTRTTLDEIRRFYGSKSAIVRGLAHNVLTATVLFHDTLKGDRETARKMFAQLCEEQQIGYWTQEKGTGRWMLDFHWRSCAVRS